MRTAVAAFGTAPTETNDIFKQFVEAFCSLKIYTTTDELAQQHLADQQARASGRTIEQMVEKLNAKTLTEVRNYLGASIQVFRCRPCKGDPTYSHLQFAAKYPAPQVTQFLQALTRLMTDQAERGSSASAWLPQVRQRGRCAPCSTNSARAER